MDPKFQFLTPHLSLKQKFTTKPIQNQKPNNQIELKIQFLIPHLSPKQKFTTKPIQNQQPN